jgi:hypothetical protein
MAHPRVADGGDGLQIWRVAANVLKGCSELLGNRKQAKLQWLQDPSTINGDNLDNIRLETSRNFRNKKKEYLKDKIDELAMNRTRILENYIGE